MMEDKENKNMCGVYYLERIYLPDWCREDELYKDFRWNGDFHPGSHAPVIVAGENNKKLTIQKWGYPMKNSSQVIFNARCESILEKPLFQKGIDRHRIIVPASGFYEWNQRKEKNTFHRMDHKMMYLAGFYDSWDENRFVIVTTRANQSMKDVHDRMPLILEENQIDDWLFSKTKAMEILRETPCELERVTPFEQLSLF